MGDEYQTCPYNPAHQILPSRMSNHLVRCSRSYPNLEICFYNASHHVKKGKMAEHLEDCPDKAKADARNIEKVLKPSKMASAKIVNHVEETNENEEDWGAEADLNPISYQPKDVIQNRKIFRSIQNATPAQRREFREQEKERHRGLEDAEVDDLRIPGLNLKDAADKEKTKSKSVFDESRGPAISTAGTKTLKELYLKKQKK